MVKGREISGCSNNFEQSQGWQLNKQQRQQIRINADKFKIGQFKNASKQEKRQSYLEVLKQL